jgi:alkyldihydroxyacetonephosphate synthase
MNAIDDLRARLPGVLASDDPADRVAYARDLWPRHHLAVRAGNPAEHRPGFVVWPRGTDEVAALVRWALSTSTPVVPFGAGSGVCAGVLPDPSVMVMDLKRMAAWRHLDRDTPALTVEAGHMGLPLEEALGREGFTLGHFPSSILCSTVGGWLAGRSAGQCSGKYGKIEDMVVDLEMVTGAGDVVTLHGRAHGPSLVPLVVGSEGTLGVITAATLKLHPAPASRAFGAWSFKTAEEGWEAMRVVFQAGLRPAVARLYDPFDAMLARQGSVKRAGKRASKKAEHGPGRGAAALRALLRRPGAMNGLVDALGSTVLGGAMLVMIHEGDEAAAARDMARTRSLLEDGRMGATWDGEGQARKWLQHRYSVSYRQAPVFAQGLFSDTMEVAAPWSKLAGLYYGVRRALGPNVFVMAHLSHAYPDGCCIYFSFAGSAGTGDDWDAACEETYDRTWRAAMAAVLDAGGVLAHHHGVGRSKAPRLTEELGASGVATVRSIMRAFDPRGIMNPGNLVPNPSPPPYVPSAAPRAVRVEAR